MTLDELLADDLGSADSIVIAHYAWCQAEQGDLEPARRWAKSIDLDPDEAPLGETVAIIQARIRLMQGESEAAGQSVKMLLAAAESGKRWGRVVELLVLQAVIFDAQDNRAAALKALSRALEIAQSEGYIRTFVDGGQPVAQLLREAARDGRVTEYANELLVVFPDGKNGGREEESTSHVAAPLRSRPSAPLDPLSDRELEVLQLISEGLTNKEIAARLHLAPGTVNVHAHNIYSKLGASGRTQAVAKARTRNILP